MTLTVSYNKLWKLLIDKKMSKAALRRANRSYSIGRMCFGNPAHTVYTAGHTCNLR